METLELNKAAEFLHMNPQVLSVNFDFIWRCFCILFGGVFLAVFTLENPMLY